MKPKVIVRTRGEPLGGPVERQPVEASELMPLVYSLESPQASGGGEELRGDCCAELRCDERGDEAARAFPLGGDRSFSPVPSPLPPGWITSLTSFTGRRCHGHMRRSAEESSASNAFNFSS